MARSRKKTEVYYEQRTGVFVDVQNMFYSAKYKYRGKIDYQKLPGSIGRRRVKRSN